MADVQTGIEIVTKATEHDHAHRAKVIPRDSTYWNSCHIIIGSSLPVQTFIALL